MSTLSVGPRAPKPRFRLLAYQEPAGTGERRTALLRYLASPPRSTRRRCRVIRSPEGDEASLPGHPCPSGTFPCLLAVPVSSQPKLHIAERTLILVWPELHRAWGVVVPEPPVDRSDSSRLNHFFRCSLCIVPFACQEFRLSNKNNNLQRMKSWHARASPQKGVTQGFRRARFVTDRRHPFVGLSGGALETKS